MKNQQPNNSRITYFSGWYVAVRNYDVFETESISQLVCVVEDFMPPELAKIKEHYTNYFTINLAE